MRFSKKEAGFHIEGFPDAIKVIALRRKLPRQLASYALHPSDLRKSLAILESINGQDDDLIHEALWHQTIVVYIKCFHPSGARMQLDEKKVYRTESGEALEAFRYFLALRNKTLSTTRTASRSACPEPFSTSEVTNPKSLRLSV